MSESDYYPDQSAVTKGEAFGMPIVAPSALFPFAVMDKELEDKARKRQLENIKYLQSMQFDYAQTLDALRNEKLIKEIGKDFLILSIYNNTYKEIVKMYNDYLTNELSKN